jgi:hypothetical protein
MGTPLRGRGASHRQLARAAIPQLALPDVCYQPFSPAAMDQVVEAVLATVPAPAPPQS